MYKKNKYRRAWKFVDSRFDKLAIGLTKQNVYHSSCIEQW